MTKENGVKVLTDMVADFVAHIGKKLPDDVVEKLEELGSQESAALPKVLYEQSFPIIWLLWMAQVLVDA